MLAVHSYILTFIEYLKRSVQLKTKLLRQQICLILKFSLNNSWITPCKQLEPCWSFRSSFWILIFKRSIHNCLKSIIRRQSHHHGNSKSCFKDSTHWQILNMEVHAIKSIYISSLGYERHKRQTKRQTGRQAGGVSDCKVSEPGDYCCLPQSLSSSAPS